MARSVMLIDDSATVRLQARNALLEAGFEVLEAADGDDALAALKVQPAIDLIVCDVNMPRMNGIDFLEALARERKLPPVLMLTTEAHPDLIRRAKDAGAKGWMVKPFRGELLVAAARRLTQA